MRDDECFGSRFSKILLNGNADRILLFNQLPSRNSDLFADRENSLRSQPDLPLHFLKEFKLCLDAVAKGWNEQLVGCLSFRTTWMAESW